MIKLQNMTPKAYSNQSRDFQFIERLFDVVLNSVKTNADSLYNLPLNQNTDDRLLDLMALTLGFQSKHRYNVKQLAALCSAFAEVIKIKGTLRSIELAGNAMLNAEGISGRLTADYHVGLDGTVDHGVVDVFIPQELSDITLLRDLLNYVLPAGMSCSLIRELKLTKDIDTRLVATGNMTPYNSSNATWDYAAAAGTQDVKDSVTSVVAQSGSLTGYSGIANATPGVNSNVTVVKPTPDNN